MPFDLPSVDLPHPLDGINIFRTFIVPNSRYAREPKRHPTLVLRAPLDLIVRYLDYILGVTVTRCLSIEPIAEFGEFPEVHVDSDGDLS